MNSSKMMNETFVCEKSVTPLLYIISEMRHLKYLSDSVLILIFHLNDLFENVIVIPISNEFWTAMISSVKTR